jgi:hypothetical protein
LQLEEAAAARVDTLELVGKLFRTSDRRGLAVLLAQVMSAELTQNKLSVAAVLAFLVKGQVEGLLEVRP